MPINRPNPRDYLSRLQAEAYSRLGYSPREFYERYDAEQGEVELTKYASIFMPGDAAKREAREYVQEYKRMLRDPASRFESPNLLILLNELVDRIKTSARSTGLSLNRNFLVGTLPLGQVNAVTLGVPQTNEYLVVFEPQFFTFCDLMGRAVLASLPISEDDDGVFRIPYHSFSWSVRSEGAEEALMRMNELLTAYLLRGELRLAPYYLSAAGATVANERLRDSMELFVLGHEIAHILNEDLSHPTTKGHESFGQDVNEVVYSWGQELKAASVGLTLMLNAMASKGYEFPSCYWGAEFFFSCIDILTRAISLVRYGQEVITESKTHPPPEKRRLALREQLDEAKENADLWRTVEGAFWLATILDRVVKSLWAELRREFKEHHDAQKEVAPQWRLSQSKSI